MKNIIQAILGRKISMLLAFTLFMGWVNAQTVYTVNSTAGGQTGTDATRTGTLEWCINRIAYNDPGTNFRLVFNIGAGTQVITVSNSPGLYAAKTVEIDGGDQPSCTPTIFIRGANTNLYGIEAGNGCNLTIKNIGFQNLKAGINFSGNGALTVHGCYFGLDASGNGAGNTAITENGIVIGGGNNITIGGTDPCQRNIISNCLQNGVRVSSAGNNLSIVGNYVGTDPTGMIAVKNGSNNHGGQHGISINAVQGTNNRIVSNVISNNYGSGVFIEGCSNFYIGNNKIGVSPDGLTAMPNQISGIWAKSSNRIKIGGSSTADRNIISANGVLVQHGYNAQGPVNYDWSNMTGIYFDNVDNSSITNNYIGTDASGNSTGTGKVFGNWNSGLKIERASNNDTVSFNIVGGNGYRSYESRTTPQGSTLSVGDEKKGHGILIQGNDNSTLTRDIIVQRNRIGIGADGTSDIGNAEDGISLQGPSYVLVGGDNTQTYNEIGNNTFGVRVSRNYAVSDTSLHQSSNITIQGNYLGSTKDQIAHPNTSADDGGGIGVRDLPSNVLIGGNNAVQSNIIVNNFRGIGLSGETGTKKKAGTNNIVLNNFVGVWSDGVTKFSNATYGVAISSKASLYAVKNNIISGNTLGGVLIDNGIKDTVSNNKIGVGADGTTVVANGGNGVQIQNASTGNVIGSVTAGAGNIITGHAKNGVEIVDAASKKNSIRNNSIYCNALRGIELNDLGNDFAANPQPTFSGSETAIVVSGKASSWIELYALDGCNDCATDEKSQKLQGKTLLKAGPSPLTFAGTVGVKYTATASEASATGAILAAGGNTSEFSDCYTLCKGPNTTDPVVTAVKSPICKGTDGAVKITNAEVGFIYQAVIGSTDVGASVVATTTEVTLQIPASVLSSTIPNEIKVTAKILPVCTATFLADTATIVVNEPPTPKSATGSTICSVTTGGNPANGTVTITNPTPGVTYVAFKGVTQLAGQSYSAGVITIPLASLTVGDNALTIHGQIAGCADVDVATATIKVNPNPPSNLDVTGSIICGTGTDSATVTITTPTADVVYVAFKGTTELVGQKYKAGVILIPTTSLTNPGDNEIIVHARIEGCVDVVLDKKANIKINEKPEPATAQGSVICSTDAEGTITVSNPKADVTYVAYKANVLVADQSYAAGVIKIKRSSLQEGDNIINVHAEIPGCVSVPSLSTVNIRVNHFPDQKTISATGPICENTNTTLTLVNPQSGVTYTVIDSLGAVVKTLSPVLPANGIGTYTLSGIGFHILKIKANIEGCGTVNMGDTAGVQVNDGPDPVNVDGIKDTLCANDNSLTLTITNAEDFVTYDVFEEGNPVKLNTSPINKADPTFKIENITAGVLHKYTIKGTSGGCTAATVKEFNVYVNDVPNTAGITLTANDYNACENNKITVSVDPTRSSLYTYTLIDSVGNPVNVAPIRGNNGKASFEPYPFPVGKHKVRVIEAVKSCKSDTLKDGIVIKIDSTIKVDLPKLSADSNTVCQDADIKLTLKRTQEGVSYTLKENGVVRESKTATASNQEITFGPYKAIYPPKDHTFTLMGSTGGCDSVMINTSVTVVVNEKPDAKKLSLSALDSILCAGQTATFGVKTTRNADYTYHLLDNGVKLGETALGNLGTLTFGAYPLSEGTHEIRVVESVKACQSSSSDSLIIKVDPPLADTAEVVASLDTTCSDAQFEIKIIKTQINVSYTLFQSFNGGVGKVIGSKKATVNGEELKFGPLGPLVAGKYAYLVKANSSGCDSITLTSKDAVIVNEKPTPSISVTLKKNPICIDENAVLLIDDGALTGVTYSVYRKLANKDTLLGTTKTNEFTTPTYTLAGEDNLYIIASVSGCTDVRLSAEPKVIINEFPNRNLVSEGATVCHDDPAAVTVKLFGTDSRWPYSVKLAGSTFDPVDRVTADLSFNIAKSSVSKGANQIIFSVSVQGCGSDTVAVDTVYSIGEVGVLDGRSSVCIGDTTTYTAPNMMGIKAYKFTIPAEAELISSDSFSVRIHWRSLASTGIVTAYPKGSLAVCDKVFTSKFVQVYPPKSGVFDFINNDTICVNDTIWVGLKGVQGISADTLVSVKLLLGDGGVEYLDTIVRPFDFDSYRLTFTKVGKYVLEYKTVSECTREVEMVTQTIVVLPYPVANAGEYPIIDMKYYPREVVLDGSNSSHSTDEWPFVYKWSIKPYSNITNSNSMVASFVPEQTTQDVMLWVANAHKGMCPTRDTARITIDLGIFIPNVFTPNNDGDHDTWEILNVNAFYPEVQVDIYSKWGTLVYSSKGYPNAWDGTRNGQDVPAATYYYVIDLKKPGFKPVAGSVTIIR